MQCFVQGRTSHLSLASDAPRAIPRISSSFRQNHRPLPSSQKLLVSRSARERSLRCNVHVPDKVCDESLNTADAGSSLAPDADGDESPNTAHASPNQVPDMVGGTSTDTAHASPNQVPDMVGGTSTDTAHAGPSHVTDAVGNESIDAAHAAPSHVPDAVGNESNDQAHAAPSLVPDIEGDESTGTTHAGPSQPARQEDSECSSSTLQPSSSIVSDNSHDSSPAAQAGSGSSSSSSGQATQLSSSSSNSSVTEASSSSSSSSGQHTDFQPEQNKTLSASTSKLEVESRELSDNSVEDSSKGPRSSNSSSSSSGFTWPSSTQFPSLKKPVRGKRPAFLLSYPVPSGMKYNVVSFNPIHDPRGGKYYVPSNKYFAFISAYLQALDQGHMMFLAESYGSDPFRFFMELDFNWEDEAEDVMRLQLSIIDIARRVLATSYKMDSPVAHIISIRTPFKVHLNFPDVMTTYTKSLKVREDIINICKAELGPSMAEGYEWDKVVDFPHGSFRILGSRKTNKMDSDPEWVKDKSYLPVRLENGRWVEEKVTLALLRRTSIFPTAQELAEFEQSAAFADMAFLDMEVRKAFLDARREKKRSEGRKRSEERKGSEERKTSLSDDAEGGGATTQPEEQQTTSSEGGNGSLDLQSSEDGTAKVILNVQDP